MPKKRANIGAGATTGISFINISHPSQMRNATTQREVRRFVMRDIGRSRRRQPQNPTVSTQVPPPSETVPDAPESETTQLGQSLLPRSSFPIDVQKRELELMQFIIVEEEYVSRPFRSPWIRLGLQDPTAFLLTLASASLFLQHHRLGSAVEANLAGSPEAARYYSRAMTQLVPRLQSREDGISVGVITVVIGLLCHATKLSDWPSWRVHIAGLERISNLRGGFHDLGDNISLMACWLDLIGCVVNDVQPRLPVPMDLAVQNLDRAYSRYAYGQEITNSPSETMEFLAVILQEVAKVAAAINIGSYRPGFWKQEITAAKSLIPLTHCLLSIPRLPIQIHPPAVSHSDILREMVRVSCLVLYAGAKRHFSMPAPEVGPLSDLFRRCLVHISLGDITGEGKVMALWSLVTVAIIGDSEGEQRDMLISKIKLSMDVLGLRASSVFGVIRSIAWIEAVEMAGEERLLQDIGTT